MDKTKYTYNHLLLVTRTPPSFFDQWCSCLAQLMLMVCKLQSTLHITAVAVLESVLQWHILTELFIFCRINANMTFEP